MTPTTPQPDDRELREQILQLFDVQGSFDDNRPESFYETWSPGGLVTDIMQLIKSRDEAREREAEKRGIAWSVKQIDDMPFNTMNQAIETDGLFKGIKNSLRDRAMLQAGYDPAPSYPIDVSLTNPPKSTKEGE